MLGVLLTGDVSGVHSSRHHPLKNKIGKAALIQGLFNVYLVFTHAVVRVPLTSRLAVTNLKGENILRRVDILNKGLSPSPCLGTSLPYIRTHKFFHQMFLRNCNVLLRK